jgi:DNA-binding response OmpR family regulator
MAKILVVEDDQFLRELVTQKLIQEGYQVVGAGDGQEAEKKVLQESPDLVLLDLILSEKDGFEVLRTIRNTPATKNTPVIVLSNLGEKEDMEKGKQLGATDYLIKAHYTPAEVVSRVKTILG